MTHVFEVRTNMSESCGQTLSSWLRQVPTDLDLLQLTMHRMQKAESDARRQASELKDKVR